MRSQSVSFDNFHLFVNNYFFSKTKMAPMLLATIVIKPKLVDKVLNPSLITCSVYMRLSVHVNDKKT